MQQEVRTTIEANTVASVFVHGGGQGGSGTGDGMGKWEVVVVGQVEKDQHTAGTGGLAVNPC